MNDLFSPSSPTESADTPLADRMRPATLDEVVGQQHLLGEGRFLREVPQGRSIPSLILWGPPGVGKTTLARLLANRAGAHFVALSAVLSGVREVRKVVEEAEFQRRGFGRQTILFVDEIHRFNKAQQDAFLPNVESGLIALIGATTENPSFEVIAPLLSRCKILVLNPLSEEELVAVLKRALRDESRGLGGHNLAVASQVLEHIAGFADGDARRALNTLEVAAALAEVANQQVISTDLVEEALQQRTLLYDKGGEEHYNLISALHKSLRNSDADASLYWLGRMLEAGEDPLYLARRMVRFASEDIGLADPPALGVALDGMRAYQFLGLPEGKLALAQVALYLAQAPKSNAVYTSYAEVKEDIETTRAHPVPLHLRNAPTDLMKELEYGKGYRYAHNEKDSVAVMECLPESLRGRRYYRPRGDGFEAEVRRRLQRAAKIRGSEES
jgi:putative ATPase